MSMLKVFALVGLAGLIVGTVAVVRGGASDAAGTEGDAATTGQVAPGKSAAATSPTREPALPAPASPGSHGSPAGAAAVPGGYEITVLGPTSVAVNLAGGKSDTYLWEQPPTPAFERHITGRVLDAAGKPVAGAVIVVGARLSVHMGSLSASGGAVASADGTFRVTMHEDTAGFALAMHPQGWSSLASYPAGTGDAEVSLVTPAPGGLAIHVRQGGAPREAQVMITPTSGGLTLVLATDARGELAVPLLAPGAYQIKTWAAQMFAGGTSAPIVSDVTVTAGRATEVPIALTTGVLVIASAWKPGMRTVEYFLYPGTEKLDAAELKKRSRAGALVGFLLGGQDADRAAELHDVTPGAYTLCVDAMVEDMTHLPLACKEITVPADKPTLEVAFDVR